MAVTVTSSISGPYIPNGATRVFAFDFKAGSAEEVSVYRDVAGSWELVPAANYTASVDPDQEGGVIEFSVAPAIGTGDIYIASDPSFSREGQYTGEGPFTPKGLNNQFDKAAIRDIFLKDQIDRAPKVPLSGGVDGKFPVVMPGGSWDFADGTGNDPALRSDLAKPNGSAYIAYQHDEVYGKTLGGVVQPLVNPYNFPFNGAGDGSANDRLAITTAAEYLMDRFGGGLMDITHQHRCGGGQNITLPRNVSIKSRLGFADMGNPSYPLRTGGIAALQAAPKMLLDPDVRINALGGNTFEGLYLASSELALDGTDLPADYAGEAIRATVTDSVLINGCSFLGFNKAIFSDGSTRVYVDRVAIDCINGIHLDNGFDECFVDRVKAMSLLIANLGDNDPRAMKDGKAFQATGASRNGGPKVSRFHAYGHRYSFYTTVQGDYNFDQCWADGPIDGGTFDPLWADSIGIYIGTLPGGPDNAEPMITAFRCGSQHVGIYLGPNTYGASVVNGFFIKECRTGIEVNCPKSIITNGAIRSHSSAGINYTSKSAADNAVRNNINFYGRRGPAVDINNGGGDPIGDNVRYDNGGALVDFNKTAFSVAFASGGTLTVPAERKVVVAEGTGNIGDIPNKIPGRRLRVVFKDACATPYAGPNGNTSFYDAASGGNFKTKGAFLATAGSCIDLRYDGTIGRWVEESRTLF